MNLGAVITGDDRVLAAFGTLPGRMLGMVRQGLSTAADETITVLQAHTSGRPGPNIVGGTLNASFTKSDYETGDRLGCVVQSNDVLGKLRALEWGHPAWAPGTMYPFIAPSREEMRSRFRSILAAALGIAT